MARLSEVNTTVSFPSAAGIRPRRVRPIIAAMAETPSPRLPPITPVVSALKARRRPRPSETTRLRALRRRDVPHARGLALPGLPLQDRLLRLVAPRASCPGPMDRSSPTSTRSAGVRRQRERMRALVAEYRERLAGGARRAAGRSTSSGTASRASCRSASGIEKLLDPGIAVPRAVAAGRVRDCTTTRRRRRAWSPASAASRAARCWSSPTTPRSRAAPTTRSP